MKIEYGLLSALDGKFSVIDLMIHQMDSYNIRIKPFLPSPFDDERIKFSKSFFQTNDNLIINKIKLNEQLNSAISELSKVYNSDDATNSPSLKYIVDMTEYFIKNLADMFISLEINYLFHLKEAQKNSNKTKMAGELLNFDLKTEIITINELSLDGLLNSIGVIVHIFSKLLKEKNWEWLDEYMRLHREKSGNKPSVLELIRNNNIKDRKKVGRPGKYQTEKELHQAIYEIPNWDKLSKSSLSKRLGYKGSSGLSESLKTKKWSLPNKPT
jgi:hypothetical protein